MLGAEGVRAGSCVLGACCVHIDDAAGAEHPDDGRQAEGVHGEEELPATWTGLGLGLGLGLGFRVRVSG